MRLSETPGQRLPGDFTEIPKFGPVKNAKIRDLGLGFCYLGNKIIYLKVQDLNSPNVLAVYVDLSRAPYICGILPGMGSLYLFSSWLLPSFLLSFLPSFLPSCLALFPLFLLFVFISSFLFSFLTPCFLSFCLYLSPLFFLVFFFLSFRFPCVFFPIFRVCSSSFPVASFPRFCDRALAKKCIEFVCFLQVQSFSAVDLSGNLRVPATFTVFSMHVRRLSLKTEPLQTFPGFPRGSRPHPTRLHTAALLILAYLPKKEWHKYLIDISSSSSEVRAKEYWCKRFLACVAESPLSRGRRFAGSARAVVN